MSDGELENLLKLKKDQYKIEQVNDDIIAMSFIDSEIKRLLALIHINQLITIKIQTLWKHKRISIRYNT
jgi:hypothetical protein